MIYLEKPDIFNPKFTIVSCFLECDWEFLLLLRQDHKSEPNTYWVPAWKVWEGENIDDAMLRELYEETWLKLDNLSYYKEVYVCYPEYEFIYHIYHKKLTKMPEIILDSTEHKSYIWRSPQDSLDENLIPELGACIKLFYSTTRPTKAVKAVITNELNEILLLQRNPKTADQDNWDFPGGLIEHGEDEKSALIRELDEELNVKINIISLGEKWQFFRPKDGQWVDVQNYNCKISEGNIILSKEHIAYKWVEKSKIREYPVKDDSFYDAIS